MNIYTNEEYFKSLLAKATKMRNYGLAALVVALASALYFQFFNSQAALVVLLSYPFLFVGFPLWTMGNNRLRLLRGGTRADQKINAELKGFNDKYALYHYVTVNGVMVPHLMVSPAGLIVIEDRETPGPVRCVDDKWKSKSGLLERFAGVATPVGNPTADLMKECKAAQDLIDSLGKPDVAIKGLVVFTKSTDVEVENSTFAAVPVGELKSAVRTILYDMEPEREGRTAKLILTNDDRRKITTQLAPPKPAAPVKPAPARNQG